MLHRRSLIVAPAGAATLAALGAPCVAASRRPGETAAALRFGVDRSLAASGLAGALQRGFAFATGITVKLVVAPALAVLDAVRDGEVDAALANAPAAEVALERQSLVFERHPVAAGDFVLVGPSLRPTGAAARSPQVLLGQLRDLGEAPNSTGLLFLTPNDGSGAHLAEQALWRSAGIDPKSSWYAIADASTSFLSQARRRGAFAVVDRGEWLAEGGPPLRLQLAGGAVLAEAVHAMRSFRASHSAGKLFSAWLGDSRGRSVAARQRGYRAA